MDNNNERRNKSSGPGTLPAWVQRKTREHKVVLATLALAVVLVLALIATFHYSTPWAFIPWLISGYLASFLVVRVTWMRKAPDWILKCLPGFEDALAYQQTLS